MSGYEVLKTLRVGGTQTPILILSGLAGIEDKVRGLGFGADDYMTKPFHKDGWWPIHAIVRRSRPRPVGHRDRRTEGQPRHQDRGGQRPARAPDGKEYQMLELLSLRKGHPLARRCSLIISTAAWTNPSSRSSTCSFASSGKSYRRYRRSALYRDGVGARLRTARSGAERRRLERGRYRLTAFYFQGAFPAPFH